MQDTTQSTDPQFYTKRVNNQDFRSDQAKVIARRIEWRGSPAWLYLWRKDRYVVIFGPTDSMDAEEVQPDTAMQIFNRSGASRAMSQQAAFPNVIVRERIEQ